MDRVNIGSLVWFGQSSKSFGIVQEIKKDKAVVQIADRVQDDHQSSLYFGIDLVVGKKIQEAKVK